MDASDARELARCLSDDDEARQPRQELQPRPATSSGRSRQASLRRALPATDEECAVQSVASVLQRSQDVPEDEVNVATLVHELERLPREAKALPLVQLLQESREETIPKQAVLGIWGQLVRGGSRQQTDATTVKAAPKPRARSAASIPIIRSRLLESKRKQAECDLKLLQNRIALLQHEESKAWKKIAQTKDRAQEILDLRLASLQRQEQKTQYAVERQKQSRSAQKKQHSLKKESVIKKKHAAIQIISKKFQDVEQVKTESKRLKAERERLQELQVARARAKRQAIRRQEDALKRKKQQERQHVDQEAALRLMKKAITEERTIREHQRKVQEMEEAERTLIQRLQGTQLIQREAYSVLEHALLRTDLKRAQSVAPLER